MNADAPAIAPPRAADGRADDAPTQRGWRPSPLWARLACAVIAVALIGLAYGLPVWEARLSAPQYPAGLALTAGGFGVRGDIAEVNELNHYVGMQAFSQEDVPELVLWLPTIGLAILGALVAAFSPWRWVRVLALVGVWLVPLGMLADVQFRLFQYGHQVKPDAAIRIPPFTPLVIGPTKVLNFTTLAFPGLAIALLVLAGAVLTFGPRLAVRLRPAMASSG